MPPGLYHKRDYRRAIKPSAPDENEGHASPWRSAFRRDLARLIHSPAFRRLQGKTQLFAGLESDFFRNRLTHSLEVAQIAKSIALRLNRGKLRRKGWAIDTDLMEFAGLAHDLGHPPFGHTGEIALNNKMRPYGGFEGNAQTLRIVSRIEKRLDDEDSQLDEDWIPRWYKDGDEVAVGLNLCSRTLASILKYNKLIQYGSPAEGTDGRVHKGYYSSESEVVARLQGDVARGMPWTKTVECQIMDLADDIAYSTYDIEDAFKAGLLTPVDLLAARDEVLEDVATRVAEELGFKNFSRVEVSRVIRDLFGELEQIGDPERSFAQAFTQSYRISRHFAMDGFWRTRLTSTLVNHFVQAVDIEPATENPAFSAIVMATQVRRRISVLKHLVYVLLIQSDRFRVVEYRGKRIVETIFDALSTPEGVRLLPEDVRLRHEQAGDHGQRVICDFIAGMTDRFAVEFYSRLTSENFHSMFKP